MLTSVRCIAVQQLFHLGKSLLSLVGEQSCSGVLSYTDRHGLGLLLELQGFGVRPLVHLELVFVQEH